MFEKTIYFRIYPFIKEFKSLQARFACLRCAAGVHFVSAGGALCAPGMTLIN